jgi:ribosomal-protein-alanine N-acetyltransferase
MLRRATTLTSGCDRESWLASVSIQPMRRQDVEAVREIDRLSFPSAWSAESYLRDLRNRNSHYVVARLDGDIIGYAGMWLIADEAHISTLAVHPTYRGRGLGRRMLAHLLEVAQERGASEITLEAREANLVARRLYEKFGFQSRGFIPHYYGDTGENAVVMGKKLPATHDRDEPR